MRLQERGIGQFPLIQLTEQALLNHDGHHEIRRHRHVITCRPAL